MSKLCADNAGFGLEQNSRSQNPFRACGLAIFLVFLVGKLSAQIPGFSFADIGSPASPSTLSGDPTSGASQTTTTTRGFDFVSGADELAFVYEQLKPTGRIDWTQPTITTGAVGRTEGVMIRSSSSNSSPLVFFGYQCDAMGAPQLVIMWRKVSNSGLFTKQLSGQIPTGDSKLRLEWMRHYVVASYYHESDSTWKHLYAFDLDDDAASGYVLGGLAFASGSGATSWEADVADAATWTGKASNSCWWKAAEPWLTDQWPGTSAPIASIRKSFLGVYNTSSSPAASSWHQSTDDLLTNGDHFYADLTPTSGGADVTFSAGSSLHDPVDVYMRWGTVSGSSAASSVSVQASRGSSTFSTTKNEQLDPDVWVYLGSLDATDPAYSLQTISVEVSTSETSGFLSVDGALFLSSSDAEDADGNGIPDWWEQQNLKSTLMVTQQGRLDPNGDIDGNHLTNLEEFSLSFPFSSSVFFADTPYLTIVGTELQFDYDTVISIPQTATITAPIGLTLRSPIQVQAHYADTGLPIKGFALNFSSDKTFLSSSIDEASVDGPLEGSLRAFTNDDGIASAFITYQRETTNLPDTVDVHSAVFAVSAPYFARITVNPYENHPIGPIDISPVVSRLVPVQNLPSFGQVAVNGLWSSVTTPQSGTTPGQVQLYKWDSDSSSWRAAVTLTSPPSSPTSDGYGALVRLSGDLLAVRASTANKIYIYHRVAESDSWVVEATLTTSGTIDDMAICSQYLAFGSSSGTSVSIYHRNPASTPIWQSGSGPTVSAVYSSDFKRKIIFSDDETSLIVSGTVPSVNTGTVSIYSLPYSGTSVTLTDPTETEALAFGASLSFVDGQLAVGAPVQPSSSDTQGAVYVYSQVDSAWQVLAQQFGPARDFGRQVWLGQSHLLTAFNTDPYYGYSSAFDTLGLYSLDESGLTWRQDVSTFGKSAAMQGDALFAAGMTDTDGITNYQLIPVLASDAPNDSLVATFKVYDPDLDLTSLSLGNTSILYIPGSEPNSLRAWPSLLPYAGTLQSFDLSATDLAGTSYRESYLFKITGPTPSTPSNLVAAATGPSSVRLTWSDDQTGITLFHIERAALDTPNTPPTGSETYSEIGLIPGILRSFDDTAVSAAQDYVYRIFAETEDSASYYSNLAELHWDSDSNGIPDWWEAIFLGPGNHFSPTGDDDGDGIDNLHEYLAGTNPLLIDSDGDGDPDITDTSPLDATKNRLNLVLFTKLQH